MDNAEILEEQQDDWFRTSDNVKKGKIGGLVDGPKGLDFDEKEVEFSVIDGEAIFEGDIFLGTFSEETGLVQPGEMNGAVGDAPESDFLEGIAIAGGVSISGKHFRWPGGYVPYEIRADVPNKSRITKAIAEIQNNTRIRFIKRTAANASQYPNFVEFFVGSGCWSAVGMRTGKQRISLPGNCSDGSTVHELLHALGMWHEQSREDRNDFVQVNLENVRDDATHNFSQHIVDGDDIGPYDFGSIMHYPRFAFSKNGLPTIVPKNGVAIGQRIRMSRGDINAVRTIYPVNDFKGSFTIQQASNNRFVDAFTSSDDFSAVTRPAQNNDTQRWVFTPVGALYSIRQESSDRFLDAHTNNNNGNDFSAVTRTAQNNATQMWAVVPVKGELSTYTIQQMRNGRYLDAHTNNGNDFSAVTRTSQSNDTQKWLIDAIGDDKYKIRQKSNGRYLDAHTSGNDFSVVTRPDQNNNTQTWIFTPLGTVYTIQQRSNLRYLDAHTSSSNDFSVVTRSAQDNDSQLWVLRHAINNTFRIQHLTNGRFLDAHTSSSSGFSIVTRTFQNNDTQRWKINPV